MSEKESAQLAELLRELEESLLTLTAGASKPAWEKEIKKLFAHGWLPDNGAVHVMGTAGW